MKRILKKLLRTEKGQALPMVLILMAVSGLIIAPLLSYMSSGLKVGKAYEKMADEFYAADAGIEDGLWQINSNNLEELFGNYERYDYDAEYAYPTSYPVNVNDIDVAVTIENVWIPKNIDQPTTAYAEQLIGAGKLIITGGVPAELTHQVKIYYYKDDGDAPLFVNEIGIWLPPGVSYNTEGECTLETWLDANSKSYSRNITPHCGSEAVVWTLIDPVLFTDLPEVSTLDTPMTSTFTFLFNATQLERPREAVSWITTSGVADIPYTWDADVRVFHINSQAGGEDGTTINAYSIKSDMRELGSAIRGDYRAIGNTLMIDDNPWSSPPRLDTLLDYSNAIANDIPDNAQVDAAYLYWSGWVTQPQEEMLFWDDCSSMSDWIPGADWQLYIGEGDDRKFRGHSGGGDPPRYLTMKDSVDLSSGTEGLVKIQWNQSTSGWVDYNDCLLFAFSANGGSSWGSPIVAFCGRNPPGSYEYVIPDGYLTAEFKLRFYLDGFSGGGWGGDEVCYLDNIKISVESESMADTSAVFKINDQQVYFADDEYGNPTVPTIGYEEITADEWQVLENQPNEYSYACFKEVTGLVQEFADHGNATYTVGHVDGDTGDEWSYAAWSLIIIYSSPDTKGHQLYLYDDFIYVDNLGTLEFPISGFLVPDPIRDPFTGEIIENTAAKITCFVGEGDDYYTNDYIAINPPYFPGAPNSCKLWDGTLSTAHPGSNTESNPNNVWNSKSLVISADGIDIDTFSITWDSGLLEPGDTSAQVALETDIDSWNLIYIILSFRSSAVTGGTVTYLIEG